MVVPMIFFTAGLTLASSGVVVAQTEVPRAPGQSAFTALDQDKDGSISHIEATSNASLSAQFTLLDENRNGALEPAEFARFETLGAETTPGTPASPDTGTPPGMSGTLRNPPPNTSTPPPLGTTPPPDSSTPPPDGSEPPPVPR
jgi:hypothetical protein